MSSIDDVPLRHDHMTANGVRLHVVRAGDGPPVILLHGFPETWRSWRRQIPALAKARFGAWVPDLRGYGDSDKPGGRASYELAVLASDIEVLVHATGSPRAHVVGHDWGGVIAWTFAGRYPELVDRLVICNAPHPRVYADKVWRTRQAFRSWYVAFFQLPWLPEVLLSAGRFRALRGMFRATKAHPDAFAAEDIDEYVRALEQPGALTAALNYYRANARPWAMRSASNAIIETETLVIWGERDPALGLELLEGLDRVVPRLRMLRIPDAGHWVQHEVPQLVNEAIVSFLRGPRA